MFPDTVPFLTRAPSRLLRAVEKRALRRHKWRFVRAHPTDVWVIKFCGGQTCLNLDLGFSFSIYKIFRELPFNETRRRLRLIPKKSPRTGLDNFRVTWRI